MVSFQASTRPRTFFERFGHIGVVVLPATVLSNDALADPDTGAMLPSLRASYSQAGLIYARVLRPCGDGQYWAEMFPSPTGGVETERVVLAEEALYYALPWDIRLQGKCPGDILAAMASHARAVRPAQRMFQSQCENSPRYDAVPLHPQEQPETPETTTLIPLPELFVSVQTVDEAVAETPGPSPDCLPAHPTAWTRIVWLHAALMMVHRQMRHARHVFSKLDILLDTVLSAQRSLRQSLVSASEVYVGNRLVGWRLQVAFPVMEALV